MHTRALGNDWQKNWKILRAPMVEVVAAIAVVLVAAWVVVDAESAQAHNSLFPVPFVHR